YTIKNQIIIIQPEPQSRLTPLPEQKAQEKGRLSGRVSDGKTGERLPAVTVSLQSSTYSTTAITDQHGAFQTGLIPYGTYTLTFSSIGYASKVQQINIQSASEALSIQLSPDVSELEQVVVMAYGTSKVKDVTGSISSLGVEDMKQAPMGSTVQ